MSKELEKISKLVAKGNKIAMKAMLELDPVQWSQAVGGTG